MKTAAELQLLAAAVVVGLVQLLWAAFAARAHQKDMKWAAGPRDEPMPLGGVAGRLDRAFRNYMETFPFFAAAVIAAYLAGKLGDLTLWGSALYVAARALYVPTYAAGVSGLRTLIWFVAVIGIVLNLVAIFVA
jgi:uncharacterized MAPEG superfamily protein